MPTILEAPPSPPEVTPGYRRGGGGGKPPWKLWVGLVIIAASAIYVSWLAFRALTWQPVATIVSVAWAVTCFAIAERRFYVLPESRVAWLTLWCIVGGFLAEAAQVVVSSRLSIGAIWIVMGILGIGGGFGVGSFTLINLWQSAVLIAKLLLRWRAA